LLLIINFESKAFKTEEAFVLFGTTEAYHGIFLDQPKSWIKSGLYHIMLGLQIVQGKIMLIHIKFDGLQ